MENRKRIMATDNRLSLEKWVMPCGLANNDAALKFGFRTLCPMRTSIVSFLKHIFNLVFWQTENTAPLYLHALFPHVFIFIEHVWYMCG